MMNSRPGVRAPELLRHGLIPGRVRALAAGGVALLALSVSVAFAAQTHVVLPGETLTQIAEDYGTSVEDLITLNAIQNPDSIHAGDQLLVPDHAASAGAGRSYTVQGGDSLSAIADALGVSMQAIVDLNGLADPDHVFEGQILSVPGATSRYRGAADQDVGAALRSAERKYGLPNGVLRALAWQESGWNQQMVSHAGAIGLTQIMPRTANWALEWLAPHATGWRVIARDNAEMGAAVLGHWLDLAGGDVRYALGAYYQGWHAMESFGAFDDTVEYVNNVLALVGRFAD
jgi:LysM repeat protein